MLWAILMALLIDGGEQFILGKNGDADFVTGGDAGPRWSYNYRKHAIQDGSLGQQAAPWMPAGLNWPQKVSIGFEVAVSGWLRNYNEKKAISVTASAVNHCDDRVVTYTEGTDVCNFLAGAGSAFKPPTDSLLAGMAAIPRSGKKIIYDDSAADAQSYASPRRVASIPEILRRFPFDGVVFSGPQNYSDGYGRGQFVCTSASVTLQMWRDYLGPLRGANLYNCKHNYLRVPIYTLNMVNTYGECGLYSGEHVKTIEDDWSNIFDNLGNVARVANEEGIKGLLIDNEDWDQPGDYERARLLGRQTMRILKSEHPAIEVCWLCSPAVSTGVGGAFFAGMAEVV